MTRRIRDRANGNILASGSEPDVFEFEGNVYFAASAVNTEALVVSDATYTCPYKGTCNWVDIKGGASKVAWVYPDPKPARTGSIVDSDRLPRKSRNRGPLPGIALSALKCG